MFCYYQIFTVNIKNDAVFSNTDGYTYIILFSVILFHILYVNIFCK